MTKIQKQDIAEQLQRFLGQLQQPNITFFPIRHHSPGCAWHLRNLIRKVRPTVILIEGPEALEQWIPELLKPELKPPVAIYMTWSEQTQAQKSSGTSAETASAKKDRMPNRCTAYYPICDYSPEFVALREGQAIGARLRFIDLAYPDQVIANRSLQDRPEDWRCLSLLREAHLNDSHYVQQLAERTGCRDHDELWDHLFEIHAKELTTAEFMNNVAAYCFMARQEYDPSVLEFDGTLKRETMMALNIKEHLKILEAEGKGHVLVVTGGFHTVILPQLVFDEEETLKLAKSPACTSNAGEYFLIRYSFDQLDALNGYASGMRSPRYYDMVWSRMERPQPYRDTAADLIVEIGRSIREQQLSFSVSAADEIVALEQANLLALMRGHRNPSREDFLDALRSCFVKGSMDAEGALLMKIVQTTLSGDRIGQLPEGVSLPPLVINFQELASRFRLNIESSVKRELTLAIYRKPRHRQISRFFHCLNFVNVPFARMLAGPDFRQGIGLEYLNETWEYGWSPNTEAALIKASVLGETLEEAAVNRLDEAMEELERDGRGRSAGIAVGFLFTALRMGLHHQTDRILERISFGIVEDSDFNSVSDALRQLVVIYTAREPLEAAQIESLPELANDAFRKACYLIKDLHTQPLEQTETVVGNLCMMIELIESKVARFDLELFFQAIGELADKTHGNIGAIGAAWGLFYRSGYIPASKLETTLIGFLNAAIINNHQKTVFIYGLLQACREICWREQWFIRALDELLQNWNDEMFVKHLPELRLAFAGLTPHETDRVAASAAGLYGKTNLGDLVIHDVSESSIEQNLRMNEMVKKSLKDDGLSIWLEG